MDKHISLSPCPFCEMGLTLDIDEEGGVAILHSLKGEKNCWFPSIVEIEMPVETTLEEMVEILNRRPTQESYEHALVGASLVAAARLQDKDFEIQDLKAELARLNAERRWIPVSERLPEIHDDYDGEKSDCCYAIDIHKCVWIAYYRPDEKDWYELPAGIILTTITHWMPLPEPPEGERC